LDCLRKKIRKTDKTKKKTPGLGGPRLSRLSENAKSSDHFGHDCTTLWNIEEARPNEAAPLAQLQVLHP